MSLAALGHDWRTPSSERDDLPTTAPKKRRAGERNCAPGRGSTKFRSGIRHPGYKTQVKRLTSFGAKLSWTAPAHAVGRLPGI